MRHLKVLCGILGGLGVVLTANAQGNGGGQPAEPARLVRLSVVASDSQKQPGTELTVDDFHITEDGKPQRILILRGPATKRAVSPNASEFSNRPTPAPHTIAVLFDFLNTERTDRLDAARKIGQSLKQLSSGETVFLYLLALDGKLIPVHPFPSDPGGVSDKNWVQEVDAQLAKAVRANSGTRPSGINAEEFTKRTYVALETLANQLAAYPGRHDILWVTSNIVFTYPLKTCPADWIDCGLYVPHLSVTLDRAGAIVNVLSYAAVKNPDQTRDIGEMAGLTGGRAWYGDDINAVIQTLRGMAGDVYTVAYEPPRDGWDNKFHRVKVTSDRKTLTIQARQRYYALPAAQQSVAEREHNILLAAYQSPVDLYDIGLRLKVTPAGNKARLELHIDAADLLLREQGDGFGGQLTLLLSARSDKGPQGEPSVLPLDLHLTREQRDKVLKEGIPIGQEIPIDSATQKVRVILLDRSDDTVGSLTVPVSAAK